MKHIVFFQYIQFGVYLEIILELAQRELDVGNKVTIVYCDKCMNACENTSELLREPQRCFWCMKKLFRGLNTLEGDLNLIPLSQVYTTGHSFPDFESEDQLRGYQIESFCAGLAVLSSLITYAKQPFPDISLFKDKVKELLNSVHGVYWGFDALLKNENVDQVCTFNGRLSSCRAIVSIAQKYKIDFRLYERAAGHHKFNYIDNELLHSARGFKKRVDEVCHSASNERLDEAGRQYFEWRLAGRNKRGHVHTGDQRKGLLPESMSGNDVNIALYTSSEDEFQAIGGEWDCDYYDNQLQGMKLICDYLLDNNIEGIHIYHRMHPRVRRFADNDYIDEMKSFNNDYVTTFAPEDPVSTYELMFACDKVLVFGSSMAVEATYHGIPSILYGKAIYNDMDIAYQPENLAELISLLLNRSLSSKDKSDAIRYGYYQQSYGYEFEHFEPLSRVEGKFKGVDLSVNSVVDNVQFALNYPLSAVKLMAGRIGN